MLKSFAAALLAASVIASPVLAEGTAQGTASKPSAPATEMTKAPAGKAAVKHAKVRKHKAVKHAKLRSHIKAASTSKAMKKQIRPAQAQPAQPTTTGSAPKTGN